MKEKINMKTLTILIISLLLSTPMGFSQGYKKATTTSFKKLLIGKIIDGHGTAIKFEKNGKVSGSYVKNGTSNPVTGTYSFSKNKGFCWDVTVVQNDGSHRHWGYRCDALLFKGKSYASIGGWEYKLK